MRKSVIAGAVALALLAGCGGQAAQNTSNTSPSPANFYARGYSYAANIAHTDGLPGWSAQELCSDWLFGGNPPAPLNITSAATSAQGRQWALGCEAAAEAAGAPA